MAVALQVRGSNAASAAGLEHSLQEQRAALERLAAEAERLRFSYGGGDMDNVHWSLLEATKNLDSALSGLARMRSRSGREKTTTKSLEYVVDDDDGAFTSTLSPYHQIDWPKEWEDLKRWKPFTLTCEHRPRDLRRWRADFLYYFELGRCDVDPVDEQRCILFECIDSKLRGKLLVKVAVWCGGDCDIPVFPDLGEEEEHQQTWMWALEEAFLDFHPLFRRRKDFFDSVQEDGMSATKFVAIKRSQGLEARLEEMTADDLLVNRIIDGLREEEVRRELLRMLEEGPMTPQRLESRVARIERDREEVEEIRERVARRLNVLEEAEQGPRI